MARFEQIQSKNECNLLIKDFPEDDHVLVYCMMKHLSTHGVVYGWGSNGRDMLTRHVGPEYNLPQEIISYNHTSAMTSVFAGERVSFLTKDKTHWAMGDNAFNQLGLKTRGITHYDFETISDPKTLPLPPMKSFASSATTTYAIDTMNRLWTWGGEHFSQATPIVVNSLLDYEVKQVACGVYSTCCLTTNGEVFTWGQENTGVGGGIIYTDQEDFREVVYDERMAGPVIRMPRRLNIDRISQIASGHAHTLLLSADLKTVWAYGSNKYEQLGFETRLFQANKPVKVPFFNGKAIVKIQCGAKSSSALSEDGKVTVWGRGLRKDGSNLPRVIDLFQPIIDISLGGDTCLALTDDNHLFAFGDNSYGQCGQGTTEYIADPIEVKNLHNLHIKQISAGKTHCLIKCKSFLVCEIRITFLFLNLRCREKQAATGQRQQANW